MKKLQLITAVIAFLSAIVPAKADQVVQVNVVDYHWANSNYTETVNGSFLWGVDTGTLFDASFQTTGPLTIVDNPIPQSVDIRGTLLYNAFFPTTDGSFFQINYTEFFPPLSATIGTVNYNKQFFMCETQECVTIVNAGIWYSQPNIGEVTVTEVPEPSTGLLLLVPLPFLLVYWNGSFRRRCQA